MTKDHSLESKVERQTSKTRQPIRGCYMRLLIERNLCFFPLHNMNSDVPFHFSFIYLILIKMTSMSSGVEEVMFMPVLRIGEGIHHQSEILVKGTYSSPKRCTYGYKLQGPLPGFKS